VKAEARRDAETRGDVPRATPPSHTLVTVTGAGPPLRSTTSAVARRDPGSTGRKVAEAIRTTTEVAAMSTCAKETLFIAETKSARREGTDLQSAKVEVSVRPMEAVSRHAFRKRADSSISNKEGNILKCIFIT
jgi:hypothetical protein